MLLARRESFTYCMKLYLKQRGGSRSAATSKVECFVIIVNGFQPLTIITKHSILNGAAVLDPSLEIYDIPPALIINIDP